MLIGDYLGGGSKVAVLSDNFFRNNTYDFRPPDGEGPAPESKKGTKRRALQLTTTSEFDAALIAQRALLI